MSETFRIGIVGYGNLGRGVERAVQHTVDLSTVGVFTRRDPSSVTTLGAPVFALSDLDGARDDLDVLILCGGSKSDLPEQTPELASRFTVVDSYDTHADIPEHFARVDAAATQAGTVGIISTGWDPGLFSLNRVLGEAILPQGETYTFWGKGLSQGHSQAVRGVAGVKRGVQYTIPSQDAIARVRAGEMPELETREKHVRVCYIVTEPDANTAEVERSIVTMPDYFAPYDTTVHFVSEDEFERDHQGMPHGGFVIRSGHTSAGTTQTMEFQLALESNPEFTASVVVAYARAAGRLAARGERGAKTVYDIAPGLLSPRAPEELRKMFL